MVLALLVAFSFFLGSSVQAWQRPKVNFFYEEGALFDTQDPLGDDKGPGYYTYPLDPRLRRGTFDLRRFSVYEEGDVYVFVIQTREYIMRAWPDTRASEDQGFVALMVDIYIDRDGLPRTGHQKALPGRDLTFADERGWENMILVTPLSQFRAYDILKNKTDDLSLQNMLDTIILPDYVIVQRDKLIVRISKDLVGPLTEQSAFQCMVMGFSHVVSPNRLLNRDVRAFATRQDFGGGANTYGDPIPIDLLMPEGLNQYKVLRNFRSEAFRGNILYASVPFLPGMANSHQPSVRADATVPPVVIPAEKSPVTPAPIMLQPGPVQPLLRPPSRSDRTNKAPSSVPTTSGVSHTRGFRPVSQAAVSGQRSAVSRRKSSVGSVPYTSGFRSISQSATNKSFKPLRSATSKTTAPDVTSAPKPTLKSRPTLRRKPTTFIQIKPVTPRGSSTH